MKKNNLLSFLMLFMFWGSTFAQNAYKTMSGPKVQVSRVNVDGSVCQTKYCLGNNFKQLTQVVDGITTTGASYSSLGDFVNLAALSVKDYGRTYPAGYVAGFLFSNSNVIEIGLLNSVKVITYLNGNPQESKSVGSLLSANILTTQNTKTYLTFITSKAFDEIRFETKGLQVNFLSGITVWEAFAFDPKVVPEANVPYCNRPISNAAARVSYDGPGVCALCDLFNANNIIDSDANNFASLKTVASVASKPSVSVLNTAEVYPAGYNAGFVISPTEQNDLAMISFFNSVIVETYLFGQLQETVNTSNGNGSLVSARLFSVSFNDERLKVGFKTSKPFNEIRYRQAQGINVSFGATKIYYAYAEKGDCVDCKTYFGKTTTGKYSGKLVPNSTGLFGKIKELYNGVYGLGLHSINNANNVVTPSTTDYAKYNFPLFVGALTGAKFTVTNDGTLLPAGTTAGFEIKRKTGLLSSNILNYIVIKTYKVTGSKVELMEVGTGNAALFSLDVFGMNAGKGTVGFKTKKAFNAVQIDVMSGLLNLNLGSSIDVYGGYVFEDADGDGYGDCIDSCPGGDDSKDSDGDGIPDDCDNCQAGLIAPDVGSEFKRNYCELGEGFVKLPSIPYSAIPTGTVLEWHTALPATPQNKITDLKIVKAGTYYAVIADPKYAGCYSKETKVTVSITDCQKPDFTPDFLFGVGVLGNNPKGLGIEISNVGELSNVGQLSFDLYTPVKPNNFFVISYNQNITELLIDDKTITIDNKNWDYVVNADNAIRFTTKPGYLVNAGQSIVGVSIAWDPNSTSTKMDIKAEIVAGSGGDANSSNDYRVLPLIYQKDQVTNSVNNQVTAKPVESLVDVKVYPIPVKIGSNLTISTESKDVVSYEVYAINQTGRAVRSGTFTKTLNLNYLPYGQYILKLSSKSVNKTVNFTVK